MNRIFLPWRKRNLFIVLSPFQLICAQEAREAFCAGEENHLIIIDRKKVGTIEYSQKQSELDDGWDVISRHREPAQKSFIRVFVRLWNTFWIMYQHGGGKGKVFLGDPYLKWFRYLGNLFGTEVVWLDDGAASINVINDFLKASLLDSPNLTTPKFFSVFSSPDLERMTSGAVKQNNFALLRQSRNKCQKVDPGTAIFIGQWLSERGGVNVVSELKAFRMMHSRFHDYAFKYVSHRHESIEKLAEVGKLMPVVTLDRSIEKMLLQVDCLPELIVSWYSTALFTVRLLFPEIKIISIQVPLGSATEKQKIEWGRVYDTLRRLDIDVVDFKID